MKKALISVGILILFTLFLWGMLRLNGYASFDILDPHSPLPTWTPTVQPTATRQPTATVPATFDSPITVPTKRPEPAPRRSDGLPYRPLPPNRH